MPRREVLKYKKQQELCNLINSNIVAVMVAKKLTLEELTHLVNSVDNALEKAKPKPVFNPEELLDSVTEQEWKDLFLFRPIHAIKSIRARTECYLSEAKNMVDRARNCLQDPTFREKLYQKYPDLKVVNNENNP